MRERGWRQSGHRVIVERSGHGLRIELEEPSDAPEPLHASVAAAGVDASFTPLFALRALAKSFDDMLLARLEVLAHEGAGTYPGLFATLESLREELPGGSSARGLLDAAGVLLGDEMPADRESALRARRFLATFRADRERSTPIGFYTKSPELSRLFQHDRLLQTELDDETADALASALARSPLREAYARHLALIAGVTNQLASPSVIVYGRGRAVLPPSSSREKELVESMFAASAPPPDFELTRELVARIRDGRLDTTPRNGEGFYVHQLHAAAALLRPETAGLEVGPRYVAYLEECFRGLFALTRESHVKQLGIAAGCAPRLVVAPKVSLEPLPVHYARSADAYAFLRDVLVQSLGPEALEAPLGRGDARTIDDALRAMELLFRGAEAVAREELGHAGVDANARAWFRGWQARANEEPALREDLRIAVPLFSVPETKVHRIAVVRGVRKVRCHVRFAKEPRVRVIGPDADTASVSFSSVVRELLVPETIELDVREIPTREVLRAACDREPTLEGLREALGAVG